MCTSDPRSDLDQSLTKACSCGAAMFYWPCFGSFCTAICHTLADFVSLFVTFYPHPPSDVKGLYFLYLLSLSFRWTWEYNDTIWPHPCPGSVVFVGRGDAAAGDRIYRPQLSPGSFSFGQWRRCFFFLVDRVIHVGALHFQFIILMGSCTLQNIFSFFSHLFGQLVYLWDSLSVSLDVGGRPK